MTHHGPPHPRPSPKQRNFLVKRFLIGLSLLGNLTILIGLGVLYRFTDGFAFLQMNRERVASLYESLPVEPRDIVFLGDSITAGGAWSELFPGIPTKNRGIGGDRTQDILDRMHHVTRGQPAKIFLKIGTNDLMALVPKEVIVANVTTILERIRIDSPGTRVYLQSVLPRDVLLTPAVRDLNETLRGVAAATEVSWIDIFPLFLDQDDGSIRDDYSNDDLHLLGQGYIAWRDALAPYVHEDSGGHEKTGPSKEGAKKDAPRTQPPL